MNRGSTSRCNLFQGDEVAINVRRQRKLTLSSLLSLNEGMIDGSEESILHHWLPAVICML